MKKKTSLFFNEFIRHFTCGECAKWFAIGDALEGQNTWYCPWCGKKQLFSEDKG